MPRQTRAEQQAEEQQAATEPESPVGTIEERRRQEPPLVADRGRANRWEGGGATGDPRETEMMAGFAGAPYGDGSQPRQFLPPLARQDVRQAFAAERRAALDAIPPPRRWRVVSVPRAQGPGGETVMAMVTVAGRQVRVHEGKEMDERYFDVPALRRQGVKFVEVRAEEPSTEA